MALTKRQRQVLDFIAGFVDEQRLLPQLRGDRARAGPGVAGHRAQTHLGPGDQGLPQARLQSEPFDRARSRNTCRSNGAPSPRREIPLLGRIAAGLPVEAVEQRDDAGFADFAGAGQHFALEVRGDSMIDDHICDGDYILLERARRGARRRYRGGSGRRERDHFEADSTENRET